MNGVHGLRERLDQFGGFAGRQSAAAEFVGQSAARAELQRQEGLPLVLAHLIQLHDVRMPQARGGFRLLAKALEGGAARLNVPNQLESHRAIRVQGTRLVDPGHSPPRELFHQLIIAQARAASPFDAGGGGFREVSGGSGRSDGFAKGKDGRILSGRAAHGTGRGQGRVRVGLPAMPVRADHWLGRHGQAHSGGIK